MKEKQELLELKSDWVFKRIFSKEGNEDILADLISAILNIEIKKVEIKNTELTKNMEKQKKSILDIKAELDDKSIVDIELQV
jgi:predicted transposase/invertase (TIGR01784 family)